MGNRPVMKNLRTKRQPLREIPRKGLSKRIRLGGISRQLPRELVKRVSSLREGRLLEVRMPTGIVATTRKTKLGLKSEKGTTLNEVIEVKFSASNGINGVEKVYYDLNGNMFGFVKDGKFKRAKRVA